MKKTLLLFLLFSLYSYLIIAQQIITGTVTDQESGEGLPGVNVLVKNTTTGTITDLDGNYSIEVTEFDNLLVFSFVGYITQEVEVGSKTTIDVVLKLDVSELDEVVVIGYGTQKKSLVTGAIAKVDAKEIVKTAPTRTEQALQGKTAGVTIMKNSGAPGSNLTVRIRGISSNGSSSPLYILDGMRVDNIDFLEPGDIESMEVLKDAASAAIYGAEGANGVVIITTTKGKVGDPTITYDFYYGTQKVVNKLDMMDSYQYTSYKYEGYSTEFLRIYREIVPDITYEEALPTINLFWEQTKNMPHPDEVNNSGTDWLNEVLITAPVTKHGLKFSGGSEKNQYNASLNYFSQDGVIGGEKSNFTRYTFRVNSDYKIKDWLDAGIKVNYSNVSRNILRENDEYGAIIMNSIMLDPLTPAYYEKYDSIPKLGVLDNILSLFGDSSTFVNSTAMKDENGYFGIPTIVTNEIINPIAQIHNTHNRMAENRFVMGGYFDIKPIAGLRIHSQFDIDVMYRTQDIWNPIVYYQATVSSATNSVWEGMDKKFYWQWENYIDYKLKKGEHAFTPLFGMTISERNYEILVTQGTEMIAEGETFAYISSTTGNYSSSGKTYPKEKLLSYFGRLSYNYAEKYMVEATVRRDGSSLFHVSNPWALFPSFSGGWVMSREPFWSVPIINFLKIRASWGLNGSLSNLDPFMYESRITNTTGVAVRGNGLGQTAQIFHLQADGSVTSATEPERTPNRGLIWEASDQTDIGFEMGLIDNRLTLSADYFIKRTIDLLIISNTEIFRGLLPPWENAGDVKNSGIELELGYKQKIGDFSFNITGLATKLNNEVNFISKEGYQLVGTTANGIPVTMFEAGKPAWYFYGYKTDGVFQSQDEIDNYIYVSETDDTSVIMPNAFPGDLKIVDVNGDGQITDKDRTMIGSPWPDWTFGLTVNAEYKGFDLNVFLNASVGNEVFIGYHRTDLLNTNLPERFYTNRWTEDNPTNDMFRASFNSKFNYEQSDFWVEDASWLKLRSITLGYTLPEKITSIVLIKKLRVYVSGQNLKTYTKYTGMDPEVGNTQGNLTDDNKTPAFNSVGVDRGFYPAPRTIMFGANITF